MEEGRCVLTIENGRPVVPKSCSMVETQLRRLSNWRGRTYAYLECGPEMYYQCAGTPAGMMLEKRLPGGSQWRGFQEVPVVPFPDGTVLVFTAGQIALRSNEWFSFRQVVELFWSVASQAAEPSWVKWRNIDELLVR